MQALYKIDQGEMHRTAHSNSAVQSLYREFLDKPLGPVSHKLLHTKYKKRAVAD
jgi:iron only hydrogenase large subunit-like protein